MPHTIHTRKDRDRERERAKRAREEERLIRTHTIQNELHAKSIRNYQSIENQSKLSDATGFYDIVHQIPKCKHTERTKAQGFKCLSNL